MKKIVNAAVAVLAVLFLEWISGFNFNERGLHALFTILFCVYAGFLAYIFTETDKERRNHD